MLATPLALYGVCFIFFVVPNWIATFNSHQGYIPRYGYFATLRRSFAYSQWSSRSYTRRASCQSNLKQIELAVAQYTQDYDSNYPLAAMSHPTRFVWDDGLQPYLKSTQILQCPEEFFNYDTTNPRSLNYTDYWYNSRLSGFNEGNLTASALTIITGDGNDGSDLTDAGYSLSSIPAKWRNDPNSPSYRHLGGANFSFADGHVKWLKPGKVGTMPVAGGMPTFSPR